MCHQHYLPVAPPSLSVPEWRRIEQCLWEIDRDGVPSPAKQVAPPAPRRYSSNEPSRYLYQDFSILHQLIGQVERARIITARVWGDYQTRLHP